MIVAIAAAVRGFRFRYASEDELQRGIAKALAGAGFVVEREVRLDGASRIDLLVDRVGIEVKVDGNARTVARQCARYLAHEPLDGLILVTNRVRHLRLPAEVNGKPIIVIELAGAGL